MQFLLRNFVLGGVLSQLKNHTAAWIFPQLSGWGKREHLLPESSREDVQKFSPFFDTNWSGAAGETRSRANVSCEVSFWFRKGIICVSQITVICMLDTLHVHHGNKAVATLQSVMICKHLLISERQSPAWTLDTLHHCLDGHLISHSLLKI